MLDNLNIAECKVCLHSYKDSDGNYCCAAKNVNEGEDVEAGYPDIICPWFKLVKEEELTGGVTGIFLKVAFIFLLYAIVGMIENL